MCYEIFYSNDVDAKEVTLEIDGHIYASVSIYLSKGKFVTYITTESYDSGDAESPYLLIDGYVALRERAQLETKKLQLVYDKENSLEKNLGKILNTTFEKNLVGQAVEGALEAQLKMMGWTPPEE